MNITDLKREVAKLKAAVHELAPPPLSVTLNFVRGGKDGEPEITDTLHLDSETGRFVRPT